MDEIEKINNELGEILDTRLFSTKKQAVQLIERVLDKYGLVYDFSDLGEERELFYTIEDVDGESLYFHVVFDEDAYTRYVSVLAQVLEEEEMDALMDSYDEVDDLGVTPRVDYWTTTPYLKQTRRSDDDG
jgi:uncharacterized protein YqgQ